jgi:hypothetical protein
LLRCTSPLRVDQNFRSVGRILLVIFFAAGTLISLVVMFALVFPGSDLESIWSLKPEAQTQFQAIGRGTSVALMAVVAGACGLAAVGLAKNAEWGRRVAIAVLTVNLIGDSVNALFMRDAKTLIGLPIGGLMILFLVRAKRSKE